jgi:ribose 5-phosphate isomerase B
MKIVIGSDHGGFEYKKEIIKHLKNEGYEVNDVGTYSLDPASWSEYGLKVAKEVQSRRADIGVALCKSGVGVCVAANKVKGVYCGVAYNDDVAHLLKEHDGCNVIALPAAYATLDECIKRVDEFIAAKFQGGRHEARLHYLKDYENSK